ncbi:hypothetical protein BDZ94DRAFT_1296420 [Collybia nuda]|uniref:Uncharacterized protein n=1 Tax=Collybia nuda TaxID=64659 RepID=A0A9P5YD32_9AGAR|nr:hypothetical protein BDZ94DRAFT_1296420 [Collybia nuda]
MGIYSYESTALYLFTGFVPTALLQISIEVVRYRSRFRKMRSQPGRSPTFDRPVPIPIPIPRLPLPLPTYTLSILDTLGSSVPCHPTLTVPNFKPISEPVEIVAGFPSVVATAAVLLCLASSAIRWRKARGAHDDPNNPRSGSRRSQRLSAFVSPPRNSHPAHYPTTPILPPAHCHRGGRGDEDDEDEEEEGEDVFTDQGSSDGDDEGQEVEADEGTDHDDEGQTTGREDPPPPPPPPLSTTAEEPDPNPLPHFSMWWFAIFLLCSVTFVLGFLITVIPGLTTRLWRASQAISSLDLDNDRVQEFVKNSTQVIAREWAAITIPEDIRVERVVVDNNGASHVLGVIMVAGLVVFSAWATQVGRRRVTRVPPRTDAAQLAADAAIARVEATVRRPRASPRGERTLHNKATLAPPTPAKTYTEVGTYALPESPSVQGRAHLENMAVQTSSTQTLGIKSTSVATQTRFLGLSRNRSTQTKSTPPRYFSLSTQTEAIAPPIMKVYANASAQFMALAPPQMTVSSAVQTSGASCTCAFPRTLSRVQTGSLDFTDTATQLPTTLTLVETPRPSNPTVFGISTKEEKIDLNLAGLYNTESVEDIKFDTRSRVDIVNFENGNESEWEPMYESSIPRSGFKEQELLAIRKAHTAHSAKNSSRPFVSTVPGLTTVEEIDLDFDELWQGGPAKEFKYSPPGLRSGDAPVWQSARVLESLAFSPKNEREIVSDEDAKVEDHHLPPLVNSDESDFEIEDWSIEANAGVSLMDDSAHCETSLGEPLLEMDSKPKHLIKSSVPDNGGSVSSPKTPGQSPLNVRQPRPNSRLPMLPRHQPTHHSDLRSTILGLDSHLPAPDSPSQDRPKRQLDNSKLRMRMLTAEGPTFDHKLKDNLKKESQEWGERERLLKEGGEERERLVAENAHLAEQLKSLREDIVRQSMKADKEQLARVAVEAIELAKEAQRDEERAQLEAELLYQVETGMMLRQKFEELWEEEVEGTRVIAVELAQVRGQLMEEQLRVQEEKELARVAGLQEESTMKQLEEESKAREHATSQLMSLVEENARLQQNIETLKKVTGDELSKVQRQHQEEEAWQARESDLQIKAAVRLEKERILAEERANLEQKLQEERDQREKTVTNLSEENKLLSQKLVDLLKREMQKMTEMDKGMAGVEEELVKTCKQLMIKEQLRVQAVMETQRGAQELRKEKEIHTRELADQELKLQAAFEEQRQQELYLTQQKEENRHLSHKIGELEKEGAQRTLGLENELAVMRAQVLENGRLWAEEKKAAQGTTAKLWETIEGLARERADQEEEFRAELDERKREEGHLIHQMEELRLLSYRAEELQEEGTQRLLGVEGELASAQTQLLEEKRLRSQEGEEFQERVKILQEERGIDARELADQKQRLLAEQDERKRQDAHLLQQVEENRVRALRMLEVENELALVRAQFQEEKQRGAQLEKELQARVTQLQEEAKMRIQELAEQKQQFFEVCTKRDQQNARLLQQAEDIRTLCQKMEEVREEEGRRRLELESELLYVQLREKERLRAQEKESEVAETQRTLETDAELRLVRTLLRNEEKMRAEVEEESENRITTLQEEGEKRARDLAELEQKFLEERVERQHQATRLLEQVDENKQLYQKIREFEVEKAEHTLIAENKIALVQAQVLEEKQLRVRREGELKENAARVQEANEARTRILAEQEQISLEGHNERERQLLERAAENRQLCQKIKILKEEEAQRALEMTNELALAHAQLQEERWLRAQEERESREMTIRLQGDGEKHAQDLAEQEQKFLEECDERQRQNARLLEQAEENKLLHQNMEEMRREEAQRALEMESKLTFAQARLQDEEEIRVQAEKEACAKITALYEEEQRIIKEHALQERRLLEEREERTRLEALISLREEETGRLANDIGRLKEEATEREQELSVVRERIRTEEKRRLQDQQDQEDRARALQSCEEEAKDERRLLLAQLAEDAKRHVETTSALNILYQETKAKVEVEQPEQPTKLVKLVPVEVPVPVKEPKRIRSPARRLNIPHLFGNPAPQEVEPPPRKPRRKPLKVVSEAASDFASMLKGVRSGLKPVAHAEDPTRRSVASTTSGLGNTIQNALDPEVQIAQLKSRTKKLENLPKTDDAAPPADPPSPPL